MSENGRASSSFSSSSSSSSGVGPVMHESCSRSRSRIARRVIETDILAVAKLEASDLPAGCVLNPDRDLFGHHEAHKRPARQGNLKCAFCQKVFKNHYYLDRHMDNKHADLFLLNATTCMADYCDVRTPDIPTLDILISFLDQVVSRSRCALFLSPPLHPLSRRCFPAISWTTTRNYSRALTMI